VTPVAVGHDDHTAARPASATLVMTGLETTTLHIAGRVLRYIRCTYRSHNGVVLRPTVTARTAMTAGLVGLKLSKGHLRARKPTVSLSPTVPGRA